MRSDYQKGSGYGEQHACDGRPVEVLGWSEASRRREPDACDQDQQERDLGEEDARVLREPHAPGGRAGEPFADQPGSPFWVVSFKRLS